MPILNSAYFTAWYAELRIGILFKSLPILNSAYNGWDTECRFVIRHITQTDTETETEANFTHVKTLPCHNFIVGGNYHKVVPAVDKSLWGGGLRL